MWKSTAGTHRSPETSCSTTVICPEQWWKSLGNISHPMTVTVYLTYSRWVTTWTYRLPFCCSHLKEIQDSIGKASFSYYLSKAPLQSENWGWGCREEQHLHPSHCICNFNWNGYFFVFCLTSPSKEKALHKLLARTKYSLKWQVGFKPTSWIDFGQWNLVLGCLTDRPMF